MKFEEAEKATKRAKARWNRQWTLMRETGKPENVQEYSAALKEYIRATEEEVAAFETEYLQEK